MSTSHYAAITTSRGLRVGIYAAERATISLDANGAGFMAHFAATDLVALRGLIDQALAHLNVEQV